MQTPKIYFFLSFFAISAFISLSCGSQDLQIKGSDTVLPLSQNEAEAYINKFPTQSVVVTGGGSGVGIASLIDGNTDIAMSSRSIKLKEKQKVIKAGKKIIEETVAFDALSLVVHPDNPIGRLTRQEIEDIFTGKINNWKALGGLDAPIAAYSRETSSGTYSYFKKVVLNNKNFGGNILLIASNAAIVQSVKQNKNGIGYIGFSYINKSIKPLKVSFDNKSYYTPSLANVLNQTYPIRRALFYYYLESSKEKVLPFINFVLSKEGQSIASKLGYIPIP